MPQMGISVAEATLIGWRRKVGEEIAADEPICDISSDKVDSEVPAPAAGRVVELLIGEGETVDVGTVIATIEVGGEAASAPVAAAPEPAAAPVPEAEPDAPAGERPRHSPVVQRLAAELGVDLDSVTGSGEGGRIRRED